jgi:hypothetical protein
LPHYVPVSWKFAFWMFKVLNLDLDFIGFSIRILVLNG